MLVVVVNGTAVPAAPPALLVAGRVAVPVLPIVTRIAERARVDPLGTIEIERSGHRCVLHVGDLSATCDDRIHPLDVAPFARGGVTYVPLAAVVRALGGSVSYDAASTTASVQLSAERRVDTPPPFDAGAPQATPTTIFTPQPPPPTSRPVEHESPHPRRTAIPVLQPGV
jgi:hypothetical protein